MKLQSRVVFLDTNIYISKNYQFLTHSLGSIKNLSEKNEITLILTDVTDREVRSHIRAASESAASALKKVKKEAMLIRNLPNVAAYGIFTPISALEIEENILENWTTFATGEGVEVISVDGVAPSRVFERYFSVTAPFAAGQKEKEFADAFVLESLLDYAKEKSTDIHVISTDKDLERFCDSQPRLFFSESIDAFIDAVNLSVYVESAAFAAQALERMSQDILKYVKFNLKNIEYDVRSNDWYAELGQVSIKQIELITANLVHVDNEECQYDLEYAVIIETVERVKDYDRSPFDNEDNCYPFVLETEATKLFDPVISIEARLFYDEKMLDTVCYDADLPYDIVLSNPIHETRRELDINGN